MSLEGRWACPRCHTMIATDSNSFPPGGTDHTGKQKGGPPRGCAACSKRKIKPSEWVKVTS